MWAEFFRIGCSAYATIQYGEHKGCYLGMENKVVRVAHNNKPVVILSIYVFEFR